VYSCKYLIKLDIIPDHIILLLDVDPQFGIHKAVKYIKGNTSRILRREFSELKTKLPTLWTNSYLVLTVGDFLNEKVNEYIAGQKQHREIRLGEMI